MSELHDLENLEPGVLITAVGLHLCDAIDALARRLSPGMPNLYFLQPIARLSSDFRKWAETQEREVFDPAYELPPREDDPPTVRMIVPGKLSMPKRVERDLPG